MVYEVYYPLRIKRGGSFYIELNIEAMLAHHKFAMLNASVHDNRMSAS